MKAQTTAMVWERMMMTCTFSISHVAVSQIRFQEERLIWIFTCSLMLFFGVTFLQNTIFCCGSGRSLMKKVSVPFQNIQPLQHLIKPAAATNSLLKPRPNFEDLSVGMYDSNMP